MEEIISITNRVSIVVKWWNPAIVFGIFQLSTNFSNSDEKNIEYVNIITNRLKQESIEIKYCSLGKKDDLKFYIIAHQFRDNAQPALTCSKLTIKTLEQGVKYVYGVILVSLLLTFKKSHVVLVFLLNLNM